MQDKDKQNPTTGTESDISKSQSQQPPPSQASQQQDVTGEKKGQFETAQQSEAEQTGDQAATGQAQAGAGEELQADTLAQQRTDIEGGSLAEKETGEAGGGFVGSEGRQDTSTELVEDEDFEKDGQGAPEGK